VPHLEILRPDEKNDLEPPDEPNYGKYERKILMNLTDFEQRKEYLFWHP